MGEIGCLDFVFVRVVGIVGNEVDIYFIFGGFDSGVCFFWRDRVIFRENLKRR